VNPPIGFIITSYNKPHQLERLTGRLNVLFNHPPIVCHHNFDQCALDMERFAKNVSFVRPHIQTGWGSFTVIEAVVRALEQMYAAPENPDWFVILSGTDYPIKSAAQILHDLRAGDYDAHVRHVQIHADTLATDWQKRAFRRYCSIRFRAPFMKRAFSLRIPLLTKLFLPFSKNFQCYAGDYWVTANRRVAQHLVKFHRSNPKVARHYSRVVIPEESYFLTILANAPEFKLNNNSWRYTDWSRRSPHPKTLGLADLPKLLASPDHFARKFDLDEDSAVLDQLDKTTA
jgi:hypothetical protein